MAEELVPKKESWIENTRAYIGDIRSEMKRVTWPNRKKVEQTTIVVLLSVFAFAAYFYIVDGVVNKTLVAAYNAMVK
jgi:preprotein translocase subunit SecE